jgi:hypothetical protein
VAPAPCEYAIIAYRHGSSDSRGILNKAPLVRGVELGGILALYQLSTRPMAGGRDKLSIQSRPSISLRGAHIIVGPRTERTRFTLAHPHPVRHISMRSFAVALKNSYVRIVLRGDVRIVVQSIILSWHYTVLCGICRRRFAMRPKALDMKLSIWP